MRIMILTMSIQIFLFNMLHRIIFFYKKYLVVNIILPATEWIQFF